MYGRIIRLELQIEDQTPGTSSSSISASKALSSDAFSSGGRKAARTARKLSSASSRQLNPCTDARRTYSCVRSVLNIGGSSELTVIGIPASASRRIGCSLQDGTTPRQTLLEGDTSRTTPSRARYSTSAGSSMLVTPWPMRWAPESRASQTLSGPTVSPAWRLMPRPASRA